jgi:RNA polymerase sigma-70 factor (ECF subfamily)
LDHPVIQFTPGSVVGSMHAHAQLRLPDAPMNLPPILLSGRSLSWRSTELCARRPPLRDMAADDQATGAHWAGLIGAISSRQDRAAFAALFEYFAPRVTTYMRRSGVSDAAAEELAQEALLTVWRKADLFDPASTGASAWIFTIARNLRIDALRRQRRGGAIEASDVDAEFQVDDSPQPDSCLVTTQSETLVRSALAELPSEQIRVIELSFFEDKAHAEIAQILRIPLGTVKSRLRLAMNRLRSLLGDLS